MDSEIISEMTNEEIRDSLVEQQDLLHRMRMNHSVSQLENPVQLRLMRKTVARLKTEIGNRELGIAQQTISEKSKNKKTKKDGGKATEPKKEENIKKEFSDNLESQSS